VQQQVMQELDSLREINGAGVALTYASQ
jgi:hypothetical protein